MAIAIIVRILIVKSVNAFEAEISPVIKNVVRRFPATRNGGHIMLPHWKHLLLGQRKSIANMLAQGWRLKKIASAFMQGYHPLEKFVFLLGRFWPCFRNICIRICSSIRFLTASNLLFSSSLSTGWDVSMSQPFEFVFVYSFSF